MSGLARVWRTARGAALLAVALFVLAGVRSTVMQAAMAAPQPVCGAAMAGMGGMAAPAPGKAHKACEFCAAAAHAPLQTADAAPLVSTTSAPLAPYRALASLGPRGPPDVSPRARGPPPLFLTV